MIQPVSLPNEALESDPAITRELPHASTLSLNGVAEHIPLLRIGQTSVVGMGVDPVAKKAMDSKIIFLIGLLLAGSGLISPPVALVGGIAYGFTVEHPLRREASSLAKLHLSQNQFGLWAALAIHDTSSVVGAAAKYGNQAFAIRTTVKLARALWIVPISLVTASMIGRMAGPNSKAHGAKVRVPWFIFLFILPPSRAPT